LQIFGQEANVRIAIPVFRSRISPVFDVAHLCLLIEQQRKDEVSREQLVLQGISPIERVAILKQEGVHLLICGGVTGMVRRRMEAAGIRVLSGIAGPFEEVLEAHRNGTLTSSRFRMPGCACRRRRGGRWRGRG